MGIDVIRLGENHSQVENQIQLNDLVKPQFQLHNVDQPIPMSIGLMTLQKNQTIFPWWRYESKLDEDLHALNQTWSISNEQSLFDCIYLSQIQKLAKGDFYVIFPGVIKSEGWGSLKDIDKDYYNRGQGCTYHLHCEFEDKLVVNWVPFWDPQSLVKNPPFASLWRLFGANLGDSLSRCLTFFSLQNHRLLPEVTNLLVKNDDQRSEKLASLVEWFGVYSSPLSPNAGTCSLFYTANADMAQQFVQCQNSMKTILTQAQSEMVADPSPKSVVRIISRQVAL